MKTAPRFFNKVGKRGQHQDIISILVTYKDHSNEKSKFIMINWPIGYYLGLFAFLMEHHAGGIRNIPRPLGMKYTIFQEFQGSPPEI